MKTVKIIVAILVLSTKIALPQGANSIWYIGNHAGVDFSTGSPVAITNSASFSYDYTSTISDDNGNLLFYTNGVTVFNKNNVPMPNGTGLLGSETGGQVAMIVQQPGSHYYYIFTIDAFGDGPGLEYSILDMTLDGGLGDVTTTKNILLLAAPVSEKLAGICVNDDTPYSWLVAHSVGNNSYYCYKIASTGLITTPVISSVGSVHTGAVGEMTLCKNALKIVSAMYDDDKIDVLNFNETTGVISNPITIPNITRAWGVAFSPDNTKLYGVSWYQNPNLYQWDLSSQNQATIIASKQTVGTTAYTGGGGYSLGYIEMGPDDKLYIAKYMDTTVAVISNPNAAGVACSFIDNGVNLAGKQSSAGLSRAIYPCKIANAIEDFNTNESSSIYYNATENSIYINGKIVTSGKLIIDLYSMDGKKVLSSERAVNTGSTEHITITNNLSKGIYTIRLINGNQTITKKLVL